MKDPKFKSGDNIIVRIPIEYLHKFHPSDIEEISNKKFKIYSVSLCKNKYEYQFYEIPGVWFEEYYLMLYSDLKEDCDEKQSMNNVLLLIDKALQKGDKLEFYELSKRYKWMRSEFIL